LALRLSNAALSEAHTGVSQPVPAASKLAGRVATPGVLTDSGGFGKSGSERWDWNGGLPERLLRAPLTAFIKDPFRVRHTPGIEHACG
jgi:hypothetical protein